MEIKVQGKNVLGRLRREHTDPKSALHFSSPFELLVATILSAQTTDDHVNKVTDLLFRKYRSPKSFADASLESFQKDISSVNFYKTKAKNIIGSAKVIVDTFKGRVPKTMSELIMLPGVARKTANIVLFNSYGINEGIAVDTHVKRVAYRLGLTKNEDPVKIEQDLMALVPKEEWGRFSHLLILHGRRICQAKKPKHAECVLFDICPSRNI